MDKRFLPVGKIQYLAKGNGYIYKQLKLLAKCDG